MLLANKHWFLNDTIDHMIESDLLGIVHSTMETISLPRVYHNVPLYILCTPMPSPLPRVVWRRFFDSGKKGSWMFRHVSYDGLHIVQTIDRALSMMLGA